MVKQALCIHVRSVSRLTTALDCSSGHRCLNLPEGAPLNFNSVSMVSKLWHYDNHLEVDNFACFVQLWWCNLLPWLQLWAIWSQIFPCTTNLDDVNFGIVGLHLPRESTYNALSTKYSYADHFWTIWPVAAAITRLVHHICTQKLHIFKNILKMSTSHM